MFMKDKAKFENTAKFWTETYARPEVSRDEVRARDCVCVCEKGLVRSPGGGEGALCVSVFSQHIRSKPNRSTPSQLDAFAYKQTTT